MNRPDVNGEAASGVRRRGRAPLPPNVTSTAQLVERLRRCGYKVSAGSLRQDIHRGLISPAIPADERPGRGEHAVWRPMAVRRAFYTARLRKRGVNGHVLPLLLFLRDGWGWEAILPTLVDAYKCVTEVERMRYNRPYQVRTPDDLLDNAAATTPGIGDIEDRAIIAHRQRQAYRSWYDQPLPGISSVPFLLIATRMLLQTMGEQPDIAAMREYAVGYKGAEGLIEAREQALPTMPDLLREMDGLTVDRGRQLTRMHIAYARRMLRKMARVQGTPLPSSNPLTLFGTDMKADARAVERQMGRITPAQFLSSYIADMIRVAKIFEGEAVLGIQL